MAEKRQNNFFTLDFDISYLSNQGYFVGCFPLASGASSCLLFPQEDSSQSRTFLYLLPPELRQTPHSTRSSGRIQATFLGKQRTFLGKQGTFHQKQGTFFGKQRTILRRCGVFMFCLLHNEQKDANKKMKDGRRLSFQSRVVL